VAMMTNHRGDGAYTLDNLVQGHPHVHMYMGFSYGRENTTRMIQEQ